MKEPASTMKEMKNSAVTASFLLVVKDVKNLLRVMEISVIMVVHVRLLLKLILS